MKLVIGKDFEGSFRFTEKQVDNTNYQPADAVDLLGTKCSFAQMHHLQSASYVISFNKIKPFYNLI